MSTRNSLSCQLVLLLLRVKEIHRLQQYRLASHTLGRNNTESESELKEERQCGRLEEPSPRQMSRWIHSFITQLLSSLVQMAKVSQLVCESAQTATE